MHRPGRWTSTVALLVVYAIVAAGCGKDSSATTPAPVAQATPPTTQSPPKWKPARTTAYGAFMAESPSPDATTIEGASSINRIEIGEITPASSDDVDPEFASLLDSCSADPSADAAIPMRTIVESTSTKAEFVPGITMVLKGLPVTWPSGDPGPLLETQLAGTVDGGSCQHVSQVGEGGVDVHSTTPLTKSSPFTQDWLWIIKGYYGDEYTDGQPAKLSSIALIFTPWVKGSGEGRQSHLKMVQTCFTGERKYEQLWEVVYGNEPDFIPFISLGDPKQPESLLTRVRLKDGVPSHLTSLDSPDYYACPE